MASGAIQQCCVEGFKHEGQPSGSIEKDFVETKFGSVEAYIAKPSKASEHSKGILFIPDVIGHASNNAQLLADQFADKGYLTVVPDLFYGDWIEMNDFASGKTDLGKWFQGGYSSKGIAHTPETVDPIIKASLQKMKDEFNLKSIAAVGYCFGAKYVVRFLNEDGGIDAGFVAHPSFVDDEELAAITRPLSIAAAQTDQIFTTEKRHQSEDILIKTDVPWEIHLYSGISHGFAVRGDKNDPKSKYAIEAAFAQTLQWFGFHLG